MAGTISSERLLEMCVSNSFLPKHAAEASKGTLRQTWEALDAWILERLRARSGAEIHGFGTFTWAVHEKRMRPVFILSEGFCRAHKLVYAKTKATRVLRPAETLDCTKLAIRFTTNLTREAVFSSLRLIFRTLGQAVTKGKELSIEMSFGTLLSRKRRIRFEFLRAPLVGNQHEKELDEKITASLTVNAEEESKLAVKSEPVEEIKSCDVPQELEAKEELREMSWSEEDGGVGKNDEIVPESCTDDRLEAQGTGLAQEDSSALVQSPCKMTPHVWVVSHPGMRDERTLAKINNVVEDAFQRYITRLVDDAQYDNYLNDKVSEKLQREEEKHRTKVKRQREEAHKLKKDLLEQIRLKEESQASEEKELREAQLINIIPESHPLRRTLHSQEEKELDDVIRNKIFIFQNDKVVPKLGSAKRISRRELLESLQNQISEREWQKRFEREKNLKEGQIWLQNAKQEMDGILRAEHVDNDYKQKSLFLAWERDSHVRNMKDLQRVSLKEMEMYADAYLRKQREKGTKGLRAGESLLDAGTEKEASGRVAGSAATDAVGIGFDPRTAVNNR